MAGITQTIPNYNGGISEQSDQLKFPGQVKDAVNVIPDPVWGLIKRPGAKRITPDGTELKKSGGGAISTHANKTWFHYHRDPTEGTYVGYVDNDGDVQVFNKAGTACSIYYGAPPWVASTSYSVDDKVQNDSGKVYTCVTAGTSANSGGPTGTGSAITDNSAKWDYEATAASKQTAIQDYLSSGRSSSHDIQALTIMDTTFINNRQKVVETTGTTDGRPHKYYAYVDILKTENGRQYGMNVYNNETIYSYRTATAIEIGGESNANITGNDSTEKNNDTLAENDGSGVCRGIGTQTFCVSMPLGEGKFTAEPSSSDIEAGHKMRNLCFRLTITGQNGIRKNYTSNSNGPAGTDYRCTYHREITLLHGGEGWQYQDTTAPVNRATGGTNTWPNNPSYNASDVGTSGKRIIALTDQPRGDNDGNPAQYRIRVTDDELVKTKGFIKEPSNNNNWPVGVIRPKPTPWDRDTGVTADSIIAGIMGQFDENKFTKRGSDGNPQWSLHDSGVDIMMIGTGMYIYSDTIDFSVEILDNDLMRVMQDKVNDVSELPVQCKDGYIVKVSNSQKSDEDDYYLQFQGVGKDSSGNTLDGAGSWVECPAPGIIKSINAATMPIALQRTALNQFTVKQWTWAERTVGDDVTNRLPKFAQGGEKINKVLYFRNRLALLSGENVTLSQPGNFTTPDFFAQTALATGPMDSIDIAAAGSKPSELFDGIETNAGLLVFSRNQQFLLASDDTVLSRDTAKLRSVSTYFYNEKVEPVSLGVTTGFVDNSGMYSRFQEMAQVQREGEAAIRETSRIVPTLLPKDVDLITISKENGMIFLGKVGTDTIYIYKYLDGEKREQSAWFKWKFLNNIQYHFSIDDSYYFIDSDDFLQKINLVQSTSDYTVDAAFTQEGEDYLVHMDNYMNLGSISPSYSEANNETTITIPWLSDVTYTHGTDPALIAISLENEGGDHTTEVEDSTFKKCVFVEAKSVSGDDAVFPGNLTSTTAGIGSGKRLTVGWLYEYKVDLPRIYPLRQLGGNATRADVNGRLTIHRLNLNLGKIGVYETTLTRAGKDTYTDQHESLIADEFKVRNLPWLEEDIKTIPVYEKNDNVKVTLKSTHPSPCTLHSMSWEGDFSPQNYRRV